MIIYLGQTEPLPGRFAMRMELFNEAMVSSITYHMFMFTDAMPQLEAQYAIGWSLVATLSTMLAVNSFFVLKGMLNKFRLMVRKKLNVYKAKEDHKNALIELAKAEKLAAEVEARKAKIHAKYNMWSTEDLSGPPRTPATRRSRPKRKVKSLTQFKDLTIIHEDLDETTNDPPASVGLPSRLKDAETDEVPSPDTTQKGRAYVSVPIIVEMDVSIKPRKRGLMRRGQPTQGKIDT